MKEKKRRNIVKVVIYLFIVIGSMIAVNRIAKTNVTLRMQSLKESDVKEETVIEQDQIQEAGSFGKSKKEIHGIYYSTSKISSSEKVDQIIKSMQGTKINAVVIDVKNDYGQITFAMDHELAKSANAVTNQIMNIEQIINQFHQHGIYVIGRVVAFRDHVFTSKYPQHAIKCKDGTLLKDRAGDLWLNPYHKKCWKYLVDIGICAAKLGFDEIQFDYIRFSTEATTDRIDFGVDTSQYPKTQVITDFVKYAVNKLHEYDVNVSADVFGAIINSKVDSEIVGQDYVELCRYLDYICPMIYPSHYANGCYGIDVPDLEPYQLIYEVLNDSVEVLGRIHPNYHCAKVRPWLQDFTASWKKKYQKYGITQVREQIKGVYDAGYSQWLLWNSSGKYSELK